MTFSHTRANYHRILQYTLFWNRVDGNNVNILTNCRLQVHKENTYIFSEHWNEPWPICHGQTPTWSRTAPRADIWSTRGLQFRHSNSQLNISKSKRHNSSSRQVLWTHRTAIPAVSNLRNSTTDYDSIGCVSGVPVASLRIWIWSLVAHASPKSFKFLGDLIKFALEPLYNVVIGKFKLASQELVKRCSTGYFRMTYFASSPIGHLLSH